MRNLRDTIFLYKDEFSTRFSCLHYVPLKIITLKRYAPSTFCWLYIDFCKEEENNFKTKEKNNKLFLRMCKKFLKILL